MLESILKSHLARYPEMQIQDVYKLTLQSARGSEHAVTSLEAARAWMTRELAEMGDRPDDPLIDPISADGQIVRVHLRPFLAQGGDPETLLQAFVRTAGEPRGDEQALEDSWDVVRRMGLFPPAALDDFIRTMQAQDHPAVHHSAVYNQNYRPAYRVVHRKFL